VDYFQDMLDHLMRTEHLEIFWLWCYHLRRLYSVCLWKGATNNININVAVKTVEGNTETYAQFQDHSLRRQTVEYSLQLILSKTCFHWFRVFLNHQRRMRVKDVDALQRHSKFQLSVGAGNHELGWKLCGSLLQRCFWVKFSYITRKIE
jgi:hypothetical protein